MAVPVPMLASVQLIVAWLPAVALAGPITEVTIMSRFDVADSTKS